MKSLLAICCAVLLYGVAAGAARAADPFTLEAFLETPTLTAPAVSPDGKRVAYLKRWRDLAADKNRREIWLADVAGGEPRLVTYDEHVVGGVAWRPDGALSYLAKRGDHTQVWVNPLDGTEPRAVTDLPDGLIAYWWSPDGTRLAVLAAPAEAEGDSAAAEDDRADWTVLDRLEHPEQYDQLWVLAVERDGPATAAPVQLTQAPLHPSHAAWSPDGATLALTYNERFSTLVDEEQRVGLIPAAGGEITLVSDPDRHASLAAFSPDGKRLAYFMDRTDSLRSYLNLKSLFVRDLATGAERDLAPSAQACLSGSGSTPEDPPFWSRDGRWITLRVGEGRDINLWRADARQGGLQQLTSFAGNVTELDLATDVVAFVESEQHRPGTVRAGASAKPAASRVLASADGAVAAYGLAPPQRLDLPGHDGAVVEGFLFLPPGKTVADGPFPFVMEMHGGPFARYGNAWTTRYPWQVLSHRGYAVFIANPRGSTSYGEAFQRGVYRNFGTDDHLDLMAACDALVARGIADPARLGFTGYSYGGLTTNNVISRTDRFKAAVSIAGIFNYVSAMGQNNPQLFIDGYDRPWDGDLQRMWEHSPASRAGAIVTPTLVMHGQDDEPVDPRQSVELFTYLQLNGVPSRLVLYPGEGHGINKPSHMLDYQTRELDWFDHHLLGDESAAGAAEPLPVEP